MARLASVHALINNVTHCRNSAGALLILMYAAIQVVCCHHILTLLWNVFGMLNFNRMKDQRISYATKDKRSSVQQIHFRH